jgi:cbb3-type cytochrome oxidase maturation protein
MSMLAYSVPVILALGLASLTSLLVALRSGRYDDACQARVPARVLLPR